MLRLLLLQSLKEQIQRRLVVVTVLPGGSVLYHGEYHLHGLLPGRGLVEQIQHQRRIQGRLGFLPEGVVLAGVFRRGVLDEIAYQPEHIAVLADIAEGIVAVGMGRVYKVEHLYHIALLQQQRSHRPDYLPLGVGDYKAGVCQHDIGLDHIAGLAGAAAAHHYLQEVSPVLSPVQAHSQVFGEDYVHLLVPVPVLSVQLPDTAPAGGAVLLTRPQVLPR